VPMIEYLVRVQEWTQHFQRVSYRPDAGVIRLPEDPGLGPIPISARSSSSEN